MTERRGVDMQQPKRREDYPLVLKAKHIAEIMGVSLPTAYEYMRHTDFPLLDLPGAVKRVGREQFFEWLDRKHRGSSSSSETEQETAWRGEFDIESEDKHRRQGTAIGGVRDI